MKEEIQELKKEIETIKARNARVVADKVGPINALLFCVILTIPVTLLYLKSYKS